MIVDQCAAKPCRDAGNVKPGHADDNKPAAGGIAVTGEITIDPAANRLHHIGQCLAGDRNPPLCPQYAEFRCQRGDGLLEGLDIIDRVKGDDPRGKLVMAVIVILMVMVAIFDVIIVMVMMVVGMFRPGMRLVFHSEAQNGIHRRRAARHRDDGCRRLELAFDYAAGPVHRGLVEEIGL